ncbi:hypothetical protein N7467_008006 [Penicillium canescens]|nr:hypothetical protein N7467_008006 [Penicillium canescens]
MDADNIERHTIPWQQILMFFTRTQAPHEWASLNYKFTRRQRAASATARLDDNSEHSESEHLESDTENQPTQRIASESLANQ